ncbi:MAG: DMT family transporter [Thermoleophilia bacterium]
MTPRGWALFAALSLLWGVPYLLIKVAVEEVSPPVVVLARTLIGAAVLLPLAIRARALGGLWERRGAVLVVALVEIAVPFTLIGAGEQWVSSSLTAILIASLPMLIALAAPWVDARERVDRRRAAGLAVGALGVVALVGLDLGGGGMALVGALLILLATCCYAFAGLQIRLRLSEVSPLGLVAVALAISAAALAPASAATWPDRMPSAAALWALAGLGVGCTAAALVVYFALIGEVGAGRAGVITYVNPAVAVALGVPILDESLGPWAVVGIGLIATGSWLATRPARPAALAAARQGPGS